MYYFTSDYTEGCTPEILEALAATNFEQTGGYGIDPYCETAALLIKKECGRSDIDVHFMTGGTQTNLTIICAALRPFHGVYGTVQSHINTHEAGAIERTGHKVIDLPTSDGKITAAMIRQQHELYLGDPSREHLVQPKMVYISQPTEIGSLYHKEELEELYAVCRHYGLYLFIDGARLGYGLAASDNDTSLADIARLCDVFYIGGTKIGALFGEAVVITNPSITPGFRYMIKQNGGLLAKGRLLGIQFEALFENDLYMQLSRHAVEQAMRIRCALEAKGVALAYASTTNQQFPILPDSVIEHLSDRYIFSTTEHLTPGMTEVRICTSWATLSENVDRLIDDLDKAL